MGTSKAHHHQQAHSTNPSRPTTTRRPTAGTPLRHSTTWGPSAKTSSGSKPTRPTTRQTPGTSVNQNSVTGMTHCYPLVGVRDQNSSIFQILECNQSQYVVIIFSWTQYQIFLLNDIFMKENMFLEEYLLLIWFSTIIACIICFWLEDPFSS